MDPASRTLLTEVDVPNPEGLLLSGSYATVRFRIERPNPPLVIAQSALLIDASGVRVALVDPDGTLHYRPIQMGRDYGNTVEVLSGLAPTDQLLTSLIQRTVQSNLTLQQAEARVREARALRRIAAADLWPQVAAAGSYTRERTSKNGLSVGGAGKVFNLFQAGFDANWEVDVFGGIRRSVEAAAASVEAAEDDPIPKPTPQVAVGLPSELLPRRPDVARSERQLASQTAQIGVATRDLFPRFFISGAASLQSVRGSDFFDWQSRLLSLAPSVSWPIFEGGRIRANIALQTATQQELLAAYEGVVLQAFQDVEDALVAFSHEQASRDQLEDAVRANRRAAELARNLYAQGLTDFLTVLVAEESLFTSQDTLAQTQRDVALELVALYKAVGGGWEAGATARGASGNGSS